MEAEKSAQMDKLHVELEQERQKAKVTLSRQQQDFQQQAEKQALQNGARFAGILLQKSAGPELEGRLFALLINDLVSLPEVCRLCCLQILEHGEKGVLTKATSSYPLTLELRQQLEQKLATLINCPMTFQYYQDASLIAGVRIDIGAWVLHANLKHELTAFAEIAYESE